MIGMNRFVSSPLTIFLRFSFFFSFLFSFSAGDAVDWLGWAGLVLG